MATYEQWAVSLFVTLTMAAAGAAVACSDGPANPVLIVASDSSRNDTTPRDTTPRDTVPRDSMPRDTVPRDTVPRDTVPRDTVPRDTIPRDTIPRDTIPRDTIPRDTIPRDTIPRDTTPPPPPLAVSITVSPASQERAVGDSGVVSATVRDSAGREIWPTTIRWDVHDTTTVLRIRVLGTSYVIFDAVGVGRATLIARHERLADTAVVFVR